MRDKVRQSKVHLTYDGRAFQPSRLMTFVEMEGFTEDWNDLGLTDDDLQALQIAIMANPLAAPVVPGTGGLRKLRFAPPSMHRGKRGALRVCYVHYDAFGVALLVIMYPKSKKDNLNAEQKKTIKQLITNVHDYLEKRHYRLYSSAKSGTKL